MALSFRAWGLFRCGSAGALDDSNAPAILIFITNAHFLLKSFVSSTSRTCVSPDNSFWVAPICEYTLFTRRQNFAVCNEQRATIYRFCVFFHHLFLISGDFNGCHAARQVCIQCLQRRKLSGAISTSWPCCMYDGTCGRCGCAHSVSIRRHFGIARHRCSIQS